MNLYIDYSEFELTCWNTDGKGLTWQSHLLKNKPKKSVT